MEMSEVGMGDNTGKELWERLGGKDNNEKAGEDLVSAVTFNAVAC